jgi:hypothetical protein
MPYRASGTWGHKGGIQNWKGFWLKINCSQMKLENCDNWRSGELQKLGIALENKVI